MASKILIADSSRTINAVLSEKLQEETDCEILFANSMKECLKHISEDVNEIILAVTCIYLPGSQKAEHIDFLIAAGTPVVVLTGDFSQTKHRMLFKKRVSDYYIKENEASLNQAVNGIKKLINNRKSKVLIIDKDGTNQIIFSDLIERQLLIPLVAKSLDEAYRIIKREKDIELLLCSQKLSLELVKNIRANYHKDKLSIVVIAEEHEEWEKAKLLKYGINDYMRKPIENEEFTESIESQLETLDLFRIAEDRANKDFMTGLYNRRFFFDEGKDLYYKISDSSKSLALAMIDIDKFKRINDEYGHDVGDAAIKELSRIMQEQLAKVGNIISRFGGEEFCVLAVGQNEEQLIELFESLRQSVEGNLITLESISISYTISIGLHFVTGEELDDALKRVDENLYRAKEGGRNRLVY